MSLVTYVNSPTERRVNQLNNPGPQPTINLEVGKAMHRAIFEASKKADESWLAPVKTNP